MRIGAAQQARGCYVRPTSHGYVRDDHRDLTHSDVFHRLERDHQNLPTMLRCCDEIAKLQMTHRLQRRAEVAQLAPEPLGRDQIITVEVGLDMLHPCREKRRVPPSNLHFLACLSQPLQRVFSQRLQHPIARLALHWL
jgi:hypothetical protein